MTADQGSVDGLEVSDDNLRIKRGVRNVVHSPSSTEAALEEENGPSIILNERISALKVVQERESSFAQAAVRFFDSLHALISDLPHCLRISRPISAPSTIWQLSSLLSCAL